MAKLRHLRNAPITEAIIDLRIVASAQFTAETFLPLKEQLAAAYPHAIERRGIEARFEFSASHVGVHQTSDLGLQGIFFKSTDERLIAQFRTDGFTLNRLEPYTSWTELFPEAMRLWKLYVEVTQPERVTRLALRYINHLRIPAPGAPLQQYIVSPPVVPAGLPQLLSTFLTQVVIHEPSSGIAAKIRQALEKGLQLEAATIILDIDAFKPVDLTPDSAEIEDTFQRLHDFKNDVFFASVTDLILEQYA